jgi:hypothetical protein
VLDGVPGADLAALLLNRGGQGPANTSVMAPPLKANSPPG